MVGTIGIRNRPGIIFIKVPRKWIDDPAAARALIDVGREFFRNSGRVVSVKFYVSVLDTVDGMVLHRHAFQELTNESSRFHGGRKWDLFKGYEVPASWNGMPQKWQRLFFFPKCH